jgi:hypothetical protein
MNIRFVAATLGLMNVTELAGALDRGGVVAIVLSIDNAANKVSRLVADFWGSTAKGESAVLDSTATVLDSTATVLDSSATVLDSTATFFFLSSSSTASASSSL